MVVRTPELSSLHPEAGTTRTMHESSGKVLETKIVPAEPPNGTFNRSGVLLPVEPHESQPFYPLLRRDRTYLSSMKRKHGYGKILVQ